MRDAAEGIAKIQRIREFFGKLIKLQSTKNLLTIGSKLRSYQKDHRRYQRYQANLAVKYEDGVAAGNLKKSENGTYEIITLPGLSEAGEEAVRLSIERDNETILEINEKLAKVESRLPKIKRVKEFFEEVSNTHWKDVLSRFGAPEAKYQNLTKTIQSTFSDRTEEASAALLSPEAAEIQSDEAKTTTGRLKSLATPRKSSAKKNGNQVEQQEPSTRIGDLPFGVLHKENYRSHRRNLLNNTKASAEFDPEKESTDMTMGG